MRPPTDEELKKIELDWQLKCNGCGKIVPLREIEITILESADEEQQVRQEIRSGAHADDASAGVAMCRGGTKFEFLITKTCDVCYDMLALERVPNEVPSPDLSNDLLKLFSGGKGQQ